MQYLKLFPEAATTPLNLSATNNLHNQTRTTKGINISQFTPYY